VRLFEIASAGLGAVAFFSGVLLAWIGHWTWPWRWVFQRESEASPRLFGVGLVILGLGLLAAPILYENGAWGSPYLELIPSAGALAMMIVFLFAFRHRSTM
jgi:hypothetical protein